MIISADTPDAYIHQMPEERQAAMHKLRQTILDNLPDGFEEQMDNFISYVVPFSIYPAGYHCPPKQPLPFMSIGNQKNNIAFYHMGIYAEPPLLEWFQTEWPKRNARKLDMGKSCIRLKKPDEIPFDLIGELVTKMSSARWIEIYEKALKR